MSHITDASPPIAPTEALPRIDVTAAPDPAAWTARASLPAGDRVTLHSTRNPRAEARQQLEALDGSAPSVVVLIGAGLGFVTEEAHGRWPDAKIIVVEPLPELAQQARARTPDLYATDAAGKVQLLPGPDYDTPRPLWQWLETRDGSEPAVVVHPVIARIAPHASARAEALVRRGIRAAQMNAKAREENAGRYLLHTLRNLPLVARSSDPAVLHGQFTGIPTVIVAAGPSLDRQLPVLRDVCQRALVIAADTAWRPLAGAGIDPHIVVAVDPTDLNGRHLLQVPGRRPWLLGEGSIDPRVLHAFDGRFGAFRIGTHHPWPWLATAGIQRPFVRVWGSVVTAALDLALSFGGDPIVFVGTDLAFTGRRLYCRGTTFEEDWARSVAYGAPLRRLWDAALDARTLLDVEDVNGVDTVSAPYLVEFRDWIVARAAEHPERRFINTTGAGILAGAHLEQTHLAAALSRVPARDAEIASKLETLNAQRTAASWDRVRAAIEPLITEAARTPREGATGTLADWLDFGRPSLTVADIADALRAAVSTDARPEARPAPPVTLRMYHADRASRMRVRLTGDRAFLIGAAPCDPGATDVEEAIGQLLALNTPLLTTATTFPGDPTLPLSIKFPWSPEALPLVAALEEALLDGGAPLQPLESGIASPDEMETFCTRPAAPVLDPDEEPGVVASDEPVPLSSETQVQLLLMKSALALHEPREETLADRRVLDAILYGLADPRLRERPQASSRLHLRESGQPLPLRIDALMRALTGTLVPLSPLARTSETPRGSQLVAAEAPKQGADPRLIFLGDDTQFIDPEVLTDIRTPRGWWCASLDAESASLFPYAGRQAVRVSGTGEVEPRAAWPYDLHGEIPWGPRGGSLAWNRDASLIWLRPAHGADPIVASVPFRPFRVVVGADDRAYWLGDQGGIWEWLPGRAGRRLIDTPPCVGLELDGEDFTCYPLERDAETRILFRRLTHAWRTNVHGRHLARITVDAEGQCTTRARHEGWTIRVFPYAGTISLRHDDGRAAALACYQPFSAAWAGRSLLVTTMDSNVLLFRDLLARLQDAR